MSKRPNKKTSPIVEATAAPTADAISTPAVAPAVTTREYVYGCIQAAAPGAEFGDESTLGSIPVDGDNVGLCLNNRIPLRGNKAWRAGDIQSTWTVSILIAKTDYRRTH